MSGGGFTVSGDGAWGWRPRRSAGIWDCGPRWARPFLAAAPWITVGLLVVMFAVTSGRLVSNPGVLFDLPDGDAAAQDVAPSHVALMLAVPRENAGGSETLVFFDDARYMLSDDASAKQLAARITECMAHDSSDGTLLLLCDRRVTHGEVMRFTALAGKAGVRMVQVAEKRD